MPAYGSSEQILITGGGILFTADPKDWKNNAIN